MAWHVVRIQSVMTNSTNPGLANNGSAITEISKLRSWGGNVDQLKTGDILEKIVYIKKEKDFPLPHTKGYR